MKKILLSCACCLLAVGLLAGCDEEVEDVNPVDPNAGVVEPGDDDGDSTESGPVVVKTGKLGFLQENKGAYYYFTGELNSSGFGVCSTDFSEGADVTVSKEEDSYYLSIEVEKETLYLSCPDTEHSAMELSKDPYALVYNAEFDTFTTVDDTKFLGTSGTYETLCWVNLYYNGASNLGTDGEFCASVFTTEPTNPSGPEPVGEMKEVETGSLGVFQETYWNYYYFTGEVGDDNFAVLTDDYSEAAEVTLWQDDAYYYLSIGEGSNLKYLGSPDTSHSRVALTEEPYCLLIDEETGAFLTGDETRFLGTYSNYETLSWSEVKYLGNDGQFIAELYSEKQELVAPTSLTISGASEVYVDNSITLVVTVNKGEDRGVTWTCEGSGETQGSATVEDGKVTGVSAGTVTVTATSTADTNVSASVTITVLDIPAELPFEVDEEYWLGYTYNSSVYYFDGAIYGTYYGEVKTTSANASFITVGEADGGYTLSFTDATGATQYIYLYGSGDYHDFGIQTTEYVFTFDYSLGTFVGPDEDSTPCYIGNYYNESTTYNELRAMPVSEYESDDSKTYCVAALIEAAEPTTITIVGSETIMVGQSITLNAVVGEGEDYRVTWSITSGEGYGSIDASSGVLTAGSGNVGQTITVIATSLKYESVSSNGFTITIAEYQKESSITITPESLAAEYDKTLGSGSDVSGNTSTYGEGALTVYWGKDSGTGICPWTSASASGNKTTIRIYSGAYFTVADGSATVSRVVISAAYNDSKNGCGTSFSANDGTVGTAVTISGGDQVEVTPTSTSMTITRGGSVCYCTEITIYYFA